MILGSLGMYTQLEDKSDPIEAEIYHMKKMRNEGAPIKVQAQMTTRGRITLPREVRLHMGVGPGDLVEFETDGQSFFIRATKSHRPRRNSSLRSE